MKKLLFLSALFAACTAIIIACNSNSKEPSAVMSKADSVKAIIDHGSYLANHVAVCIDCHSKRDITKFSFPIIPGTEGSGGFTFGKESAVPGEVTSPNITPFGLNDWTDEEIIRALTLGINKKGDTLFPLMPYNHYSKIAKSDIEAIIAYLRTLKSIDSTTAPRKLLIPPSMFGPLPQNTLAQNAKPDLADKIKYGEYITTMAACVDCHTPIGPQGSDFSKKFAGGFIFDLGFMKVGVANITPDSATGIGSWTEDAFVAKFKASLAQSEDGKNPGKFNTIMPWAMYGKMKEEDLRAIYAYLRTVPVIKNKVEKWPK